MRLVALPGLYTVLRFGPDSPVPAEILRGKGFFSVTRTEEELSVVLAQGQLHPTAKEEPGWRIIKVQGPLDFGLTGILASIANPLVAAGVSIFALSTFDTDYIMVKDERFGLALQTLSEAGFGIDA